MAFERLAAQLRGAALTAGALSAAVLATGCCSTVVYQPMRAVHRPVVLKRKPDTFAGTRVLVRCMARKLHFPRSDAFKLCNNVVEDLRRQGAEAEAMVPYGRSWVAPEVFDGKTPDLTIQISNRIEHQGDSNMKIWSALTCMLVPYRVENTQAQAITWFGRDGSVLLEETFRERFVEVGGLAVGIADVASMLSEDDGKEVSTRNSKKDFTRDFYGQLRQQTLNAKVRSELLGLTRAPVREGQQAAAATPKTAGESAPEVVEVREVESVEITGGIEMGEGPAPEPAQPAPEPVRPAPRPEPAGGTLY